VACGLDDWRVLELHHLAGRKLSDECVILCANCHRTVTDMQKDHPPTLDGSPTPLESRGRLLLGLADLDRLKSEFLDREGRALIEEGQSQNEKDQDDAAAIPN